MKGGAIDFTTQHKTEREYAKLFSGKPLDGTRLAVDIARSVPEVNQRARMEDFRADLKRRVAKRLGHE